MDQAMPDADDRLRLARCDQLVEEGIEQRGVAGRWRSPWSAVALPSDSRTLDRFWPAARAEDDGGRIGRGANRGRA